MVLGVSASLQEAVTMQRADPIPGKTQPLMDVVVRHPTPLSFGQQDTAMANLLQLMELTLESSKGTDVFLEATSLKLVYKGAN